MIKSSTPKPGFILSLGSVFILFLFSGCLTMNPRPNIEFEGKDRYDGPDKAAQFEFDRTKDPATGKVPREKYLVALQKTIDSKFAANHSPSPSPNLFGAGWIERGPNSDVTGPSNGNTRANSGITSGRIRAILVDSNDATHKTVFIGGVDGGLWKTTDITAAPATWTLVNDFLSNLAISAICQDPRPGFTNIMYFCTGESYFNADAVQGNGVFKSTDGGATWALIPSTSTFVSGTRILCDYLGNVYLATRGSGLQRSNNAAGAIGSITWTNITPTGLVTDICDLEISSTAVTGRLHVVSGIFSVQAYRFCNTPESVVAAGWTTPTTGFPSFSDRAEIACSGNTLYALPANGSFQVPTIYKSTDGGANWASTGGVPSSTWASGQGWYALAVDINPTNANDVIIGGLDTWRSTNAGASWTQLSTWVGTTPVNQYVHADVHKVIHFYGNILFASDGGIFYSADNGTTIRDRNQGLRIKQFYSCAIHPSTTNYFLAGAQDNGVHQFSTAGLSSTIEVTGGDGMGVAIDQVTPANQFANYVYNVYNRSTNGGSGWSGIAFYKGTNAAASYFGSFVNPLDYDNTNKIIYAGGDGGEFFRWTTATTTAAGNYFVGGSPTFPAGAAIVSSITNFSGAKVSTVTVSPYTNNRVYFGTTTGRVVYIDAANTAASGTAGTNITGASFPAGANVSCINTGTDDNNLICSFSNYGVASVWVSTNAGVSWTSLDNNAVNLPDMPVRWCMFYPGDNTRAILATETGIWETDLINGTSTVWAANASFPTVSIDMLKYRVSDGTLIAATHGRGLWSTTINSLATADFRTKATGNYTTTTNWEFNTYGSTYIDARIIPAATNNVLVQLGHTLTLNANHVINTGKTFTVNGSIDANTSVISGAGGFTLAAGATFASSMPGATGISDNITVSGTKTFTDGANYVFNNATTVPFGSNFTTVTPNNVTVGGNVTLDKPTFITGILGFTGSSRSLNTGNNLTLVSNASNTARIYDLTKDFVSAGAISGNTITGNATVQRYIPLPNAGTGRRYRLLTPTVNTATTINANWQEGQSNTIIATNVNTLPGFGTQITGAGGSANGFDITNSNQSSLYATTNGVTPTYTAFANTNVNTMNAKTGYFLFIRGDRSMMTTLAQTTGMPTSSTTLRATGTLLTGTQTSFTNPLAGGAGVLNLVTNPYASPIDWSLIFADAGTTNVGNAYTLWDAEVGTRGGFITVTNAGVTSGGATVATVNIQPGQAFFVQSAGAAVPTLSIKESHKSGVNSNGIYSPQPSPMTTFNTSLYFTDVNGYRQMADGVTAVYDNKYSAALDGNDAVEINNWDENIAIARNGKHLAIESRPQIISNDDLPLFMNNMRKMKYEFQFTANNFTDPSLTAAVIDNFTGSRTPIMLSGTTVFPFEVTSDPASSATDRFKVVFGAAVITPITSVTKGITVYPNPVTQGLVNVQMNGLEKGLYTIRLMNSSGQVIISKQVNYNGGYETEKLTLGSNYARGTYQLEMLMPGGRRVGRKLLIN